MSYGRPWYVQATDAIHRLTVLSLLGATGYFAVGLGMTLYANRGRRPAMQPRQLENASKEESEERD